MCDTGDVRLVNSNLMAQGTVEVCADGTWGSVCSVGWHTDDAAVVCHQLGLNTEGLFSVTPFLHLLSLSILGTKNFSFSGWQVSSPSAQHSLVLGLEMFRSGIFNVLEMRTPGTYVGILRYPASTQPMPELSALQVSSCSLFLLL